MCEQVPQMQALPVGALEYDVPGEMVTCVKEQVREELASDMVPSHWVCGVAWETGTGRSFSALYHIPWTCKGAERKRRLD